MKLLLVIAKHGFRDEEYKIPSDYFRKNGIDFDTASTEKGICVGKLGMKAEANISLNEVSAKNYSAVILIGGPGSALLVGNKEINKILKEAQSLKILIAAICYAPVILARAGILKGKRATVWNDDGKQSLILEQEGAEYLDEEVVKDGLVITAPGPEAAARFAEEIVKALNK